MGRGAWRAKLTAMSADYTEHLLARAPVPGVTRVLPARLALLLPPAPQRELPAQDRCQNGHTVRVVRFRTRDPVK
jgi:hypothetical protein